ncbi:serine/threonine-protein kinase MRCK alpha-like [Stegodyphus dumicola]|uniref:serine/threonine-protein kinase MRCK alpha-like n=1 Tax=Stegodyphus dumicola TaxID=202533 RepID=UPI0015AC913D|nr:serine/threonine-protein kinase MRCK alpha-like [Stegodyphus dumicola]
MEGAIAFGGNCAQHITLTRLLSGHLKCLKFDQRNKIHPIFKKFNTNHFTPGHVICLELVKRGPIERTYLRTGNLGIFVDGQGRKTRDKELMFPALPTGVSQRDEFLCIYSESHVDVFEVNTGDWVQTVNLKKTKPLSTSGMLCLTLATELPHLVYLHNVQHRENQIRVPEVTIHHVKERSGKTVLSRTRRRFSVREPEKAKTGKGNTTERRSRMISAPTNFNHVSHMGPGEGIQLQKLMDLPAVKPPSQQCQTPTQTPTSVSTPVSSDERSQRTRSVPQPKPLPRALQDSNSRRTTHNGSASNNHPSFMNPWNQRPPVNTASPDGSGSVSSQEHSTPSVHTAGSTQAHSSGHEEQHEQSSPRHSIASNTSSNVSYPPSPRERRTTAPAATSVPLLPLHAPNADDHGGSSSYESQS